jgi:hypothetical protein
MYVCKGCVWICSKAEGTDLRLVQGRPNLHPGGDLLQDVRRDGRHVHVHLVGALLDVDGVLVLQPDHADVAECVELGDLGAVLDADDVVLRQLDRAPHLLAELVDLDHVVARVHLSRNHSALVVG